MTEAKPRHTWAFFRAGGFDQVKIRNGNDICHLDQLDPKLWAALSCPTRGLHFDSKTLDLIDTDKDGRIRVPEIIAAAKWACSLLKDQDRLLDESPTLPIDQINDATPEGKQVLSSAKQLLVNLGKTDATSVSIEDTTDIVRIFAQTRLNGDGIIPVDAAPDDFNKGVITDIITTQGSLVDRSGKPGIDLAKLEAFVKDLQAYSDWWKSAETEAATVLPLGDRTSSAYDAYDAVDGKIDDYFARCRLAAYDSRAQMALNRQETEYLTIAAKDLSITADEVAGFPLARIGADKPLPLDGALNPAWVDRIKAFLSKAVQPLLGERESLSEADWTTIKGRFAAYEAWRVGGKGTSVEKLGLARIREMLASNAKATITDLIAQDKALEPEANAIATVDKLVRYNRDLHRLLINFINFRDFYDQDDEPAIFQAGRLYLDQRSCELCVRVEDITRHAGLAPLSRAYLAYCDCVRKGGTDKMTIVAAFTAGDSDNLMVGRNGVFYDRSGQDWDATITKVYENPISIRQAFMSPYKRVLRMVEEQIAKRAAAADTSSTTVLTSAAGTAIDSATTGQAPKAKPKIDIGTVAAIGVAVGGITAALGALLSAFFGLGFYMPLGVLGLILLISGPSMVIAWLKLRQRNLGPLLDANGWAVNTRAKINIPFGRTLTGVAKLPPGSRRDLRDPYAESKQGRIWTLTIAGVFLICWALWYFGFFNHHFPHLGLPKSALVLRQDEATAKAEEDAKKKAETEKAEAEAAKAKAEATKAGAATTQPESAR